MYDLIIIGGGAAGLSAAVYALGKRLDTLVMYEELAGKAGTRQHVARQAGEEFLAGADAVRTFERYVSMRAGHTLRDRAVDVAKVAGGFQITTQRHGCYTSTAVIVATGAAPIRLEVPGARELLGYGLGYSAITHAHLMAGKVVAVIGANVRALRGVRELARIAARVYLVAPDAADLATPLAATLRRWPNVELLEGYAVREIVGDGNVEALVVSNGAESRRLNVDAAFVDMDLAPNSACVSRLARTDPSGFIWVDERMATTVPGMYAAGDVTTAFGEQILIAIGDGARAALSAYDYILAHTPVPELAGVP